MHDGDSHRSDDLIIRCERQFWRSAAKLRRVVIGLDLTSPAIEGCDRFGSKRLRLDNGEHGTTSSLRRRLRRMLTFLL